jgi:hypothetical protein
MSINGQQIINIGLPNESAGSDSLYEAFNKTEDNFTTLFTCASPYTNFVALTGIGVTSNSNTGTVSITNTGVTNIVAGTNITINQSNGNVTISSTGGGNGGGSGTVTSVGLAPVSNGRIVVTNSPIVSSGNIGIDLATTGVVPGTYTAPTVTLDAYGRITSAANTTSSGTVTSVGIIPGSGIAVASSPVTTVGNMTVTNTGVVRLTAGLGITLSAPNGIVRVSSVYTGTVTSIGINSNTLTVSSSPVTTSGNIAIELPSSITLSGNITAANGNLGNLARANFFSGDGGLLSNLAGANVTGTVANANNSAFLGGTAAASYLLTTGTGSSLTAIAGANVTGTVANATTVIGATQNNITTLGALTVLSSGANTTAGTITGNWSLSTGSRLSATYADLAEYYQADATYEPGTVLMFGGDNEVTLAEEATNRVAGVVSTNPAYAMNSGCPDIAVAIALQGRVPCKVQGTVRKGDMMISAGSGYAVACSEPRLGQVIGKALENFDLSDGVIEIVVGRL